MADRRRRQFLTLLGGGIVAALPLTASAQQTPALIGFLVSGAAGSFAIFVEAFKQGMHDNGMIEGRDYVLDLRYADGDYSRFETLAAELVQRKPAAIIVTTISAARAAQRATSTIPVVMTGLIDPVGQGLIATFAALARQPPEALVIMSDAALYDLREPISALALKHQFPTIAYVPEFTDAGALMSYGPPRRAMYHRTAEYVKKILTGAKPSDLPVQQPTQVELSINLRTAKALGITIPDTVLARADPVIE